VRSALKQAEDEVRHIGKDKGRLEHFHFSVAFASELTIAYLVKAEARRQGFAIECEYQCKDRHFVELCSVINGAYTASLKIRGACGVFGPNKPTALKVHKGWDDFAPAQEATDRFKAWILAVRDCTTTETLDLFVKNKREDLVNVFECAVSDPIPINRTAKVASVCNGYQYDCLRAVVFNDVTFSRPSITVIPRSFAAD
jgi:hypothetical protein